MAKYKEMSVARACNYLLNGWSLDGVWMDYDDDDAEGGAARAYDCNGKLWAMGYSFTPGSDPGPVTGYCRMLREACALRAVRHLVGVARAAVLRPSQVFSFRVTTEKERLDPPLVWDLVCRAPAPVWTRPDLWGCAETNAGCES